MESIIFVLSLKYIAIVSALLVIITHNPINSIIYLIITFLINAIILFYLNITFFSILILIVYIGAIAVLFLFIIMLINIKTTYKYFSIFEYIPITTILILTTLKLISNIYYNPYIILINKNYTNWVTLINAKNNIESLGLVLYTWFSSCMLLAGCILLISLLGASIAKK